MFDELTFKSFLWKGQLRDAVDYLRGFKEKEEVLSKYINIFNEGQYLIDSL